MPEREIVHKLKHFGLSQRIATKLVQAHYNTPRLIKAASDEDLLAIPSFEAGDVQEIREKIC